jgi:hypothetical protein
MKKAAFLLIGTLLSTVVLADVCPPPEKFSVNQHGQFEFTDTEGTKWESLRGIQHDPKTKLVPGDKGGFFGVAIFTADETQDPGIISCIYHIDDDIGTNLASVSAKKTFAITDDGGIWNTTGIYGHRRLCQKGINECQFNEDVKLKDDQKVSQGIKN